MSISIVRESALTLPTLSIFDQTFNYEHIIEACFAFTFYFTFTLQLIN